MPTIGYGEDGLTYQALHAQRGALLAQLGDPTPPSQCLVYFRPSFGRSSSPQFGEFDGILATAGTIYLIETKWNSGPHFVESIGLRPNQFLRHQIFAWYYQTWQEAGTATPPPTWAEFVDQQAAAFATAFPGCGLAQANQLLGRNLHAILQVLSSARSRRPIRNILLFFSPPDPQNPQAILPGPRHVEYLDQPGPVAEADRFRIVTLPYFPIGATRYFWMED